MAIRDTSETGRDLEKVDVGGVVIGLYDPPGEFVHYWKEVSDGHLVSRYCPDCGKYLHPRRLLCRNCGNTELEWRPLAGTGTIYSYSIVHRATHPSREGRVPYVLGVVELDEEVWLFTEFLLDPADVAIGVPVKLEFAEERGITVPKFGPAK
jgi:uncharacterized OB-fold protein